MTQSKVASPPPNTLEGDVQKLKKLLAYANPYAMDRPLEDPVGTASQFFRPEVPICAAAAQRFPDIEMLLARDTAPVPAPINREGYSPNNHFHYWMTGLVDLFTIRKLLEPRGLEGGRVFDFGGSTGRLFRHFLFQSDEWEVWSSDFNLHSVEWNLRHMPPRLKPLLNNYYPSLPLEDAYFDLITAYSVFTHLDETEVPWLLELRRITRPGGFLILTTAGQTTWSHFTGRDGPRRKQVQTFRPDLLQYSTLPEGKHVVTWRDDNPYRHMTYTTEGHVRNVWGRFFDIVSIEFAGHQDSQDVVLLRKPS